MKLEAVVVSINYSDFLKHTLSQNKQFFDKIVVVTDDKDLDTKKVCDFYGVECVCTGLVYEGDSKVPNKGIAINEGLKRLDLDGWVIQLDADIWLPKLTRELLDRFPLQKDHIYGVDRFMCNSYEDWMKFLNENKKPMHESWIYMHTDFFPIGTRLVQYKGEGYWPIGFFQLWNPNGSGVKTYPTHKVGFDRTDVLHLKQFKKGKRSFIPDFICVHLASQSHAQGQNWRGRSTAKFGPKDDSLTEVPKKSIWKKIFDILTFVLDLFLNLFRKGYKSE